MYVSGEISNDITAADALEIEVVKADNKTKPKKKALLMKPV